MWPAKAYVRLFLIVACLVISAAALVNVFADNADVLARARTIGCPKGTCDLARMDRTPFAQTFDFRATSGVVSVRCARAAVFFGEYGCARQ
jgi:hypothetical protein